MIECNKVPVQNLSILHVIRAHTFNMARLHCWSCKRFLAWPPRPSLAFYVLGTTVLTRASPSVRVPGTPASGRGSFFLGDLKISLHDNLSYWDVFIHSFQSIGIASFSNTIILATLSLFSSLSLLFIFILFYCLNLFIVFIFYIIHI